MTLTKPAGTWTYEDLFSLPDDGQRYEIIDGELFEMPSPGSAHALIVAALIRVLMPLVEGLGGRWVTAPLDVFFAGANPVQPDFLAVLPSGPARIVTRGVEGPPDLIIEVISPSNRLHDVLTKRALYGRGGVREYWIVDPEARTIEILTLDRDALHLALSASGMDPLVSPLLGELPVLVDDLFPTIED